MTTIVELQAQLGQSHLKVEQLLKQKLQLMATCQDHHSAQVDDNVEAINLTPSSSCSPLIIQSLQHDDDNNSSDGIATDSGNGITTTAGARINAATQTILDEVKGMKSLTFRLSPKLFWFITCSYSYPF